MYYWASAKKLHPCTTSYSLDIISIIRSLYQTCLILAKNNLQVFDIYLKRKFKKLFDKDTHGYSI